MVQMYQKIPAYLNKPFTLLDDHSSKTFLILFVGIFSTLFLIHYNPFNLLSIRYHTALGSFLPIWIGGIFGAVILSFTQFIFRSHIRFNSFNNGQYLLWVVFELFLICLGMYLLFGEHSVPFFTELIPITKYTFSLALIPYVFACLILAVRKLSSQEPQKPTVNHDKIPLQFKDENGKLRLALQANQLLILKSDGNYTSVVYLENKKVVKKLVRTSLKILESELSHEMLVRVHRSYMVNLMNITSFKRDKSTFELYFDDLPDFSIKVSSSYRSTFEFKMNSISN